MKQHIMAACAAAIFLASAPSFAATFVFDAAVTQTPGVPSYPTLGSPATVTLGFDTSADPDLVNSITGAPAGTLSDYVFDAANQLALADAATPPGDRLTPADILFANRAFLPVAGGGPALLIDFKPTFSVTFAGGSASGFTNTGEFGNLPRIFDAAGGILRVSYEAGTTTAGTGVVFVASSRIQSDAVLASDPTTFTLADFFTFVAVPGFARFVSLNIDTNAANVGGPSIAQLNFGPSEVPIPGAALLFLAGAPFLFRRRRA